MAAGGLLEVLVTHRADALRAVEGGADRLLLVGEPLDGPREDLDDAISPAPDLVAEVCSAAEIPVRALLRLREGYGTDGGEAVRLRGLAQAYLDAGVDGIEMGYLNGHGEIDQEVLGALLDAGDWPWTCSRAIDHSLDADRAWRALARLPRLDAVCTAGSARDLEHGLDDLLRQCRELGVAALVLAGGDLHPDHVPWLARAGVSQFRIDRQARPDRTWKAYVDAGLVRSWKRLVDDAVARAG